MPQVRLADGGGKEIVVSQYGEKAYFGVPIIPEAIPENVHCVEIKDNDVLILSYPKSGCHWLHEIMTLLLAGSADVEVVNKELCMLEVNQKDKLETLTSPRILNTHLYFSQLPPKVQEGKVKAVFIYRNPKDVAVSFYNHHTKLPFYEYKGKWEDYLPNLFLKGQVDFGDIFTYTRDWEVVMDSRPDLPIFTVSYEALQADSVARVKDLAAFLGCSVDDATVRQIVDRCSFGSMKERNGKEWVKIFGDPIIYRKGKVGDWKTWFTVAQSEMMDSVCQDRMKDSRIQFQYTQEL